MKKFLTSLLLSATVLLLALAPTASLAQAGGLELPAQPFGESRPIPGRYIVVFKDDVDNPAAQALNMMRGRGGRIHHAYSRLIKGFSATIPDHAFQLVRMNPNVAFIEQDHTISLHAMAQSPAPWGLDRVDQRDLPLDNTYHYTGTGAGVYAFVVDTGIRGSHVAFTGRMVDGMTIINDGRGTGDCNGHGTHVAGTLGGSVHGVAKEVSLVPVRVLDCSGNGTWSGVVAGLDWAAAQTDLRPAVVNMSIGGSGSTAVDSSVARATEAGLTVVAAAGNSNGWACLYSPAREPTAVTVGATTSTDSRASYSNYGSCVDLFAPGSGIVSAWHTSDTATATLNGTSMAAPHVAGVAALALQVEPSSTPAEISTFLVDNATRGKISSAGWRSPNLLVYSLAASPAPAPDPSPTASFSISCDNLHCSFDGSASSSPDDTIHTYDWDFGTVGATASGVTATYTYPTAGTYNVSLTVTDGNGTDTHTESLTVTEPPPPNDNPIASFIFSCTNLTCDFDGSGSSDPDGDVVSHAWVFGDGATTTGVTPTHSYTSAGTYDVTLTVTDNMDATDSTTQSVTVTAPPPPEVELTGSSSNGWFSWVATATLHGAAGASTSGFWNAGDTSGGCTISSGANSCSFSLTWISRRTTSVTYTDSNDSNLSVTIQRP